MTNREKYRLTAFLETREALATLDLHSVWQQFSTVFHQDVGSPHCHSLLVALFTHTSLAWTLGAVQFLTLHITASMATHPRQRVGSHLDNLPVWASQRDMFKFLTSGLGTLVPDLYL